jgi:hypothetical protein
VRIEFAIGNGMRPDIWDKFQVRTLRVVAKHFYGLLLANLLKP